MRPDEKSPPQLSDANCALGRIIISRVNVSGQRRALRECPIPPPPKGMRLQDLALENRTYNCLVREGFGARLEELAKRSVGDLLAFRAFGAKCLLDLLSSLETAVPGARTCTRSSRKMRWFSARSRAALIHFSIAFGAAGALRSGSTEADTLEDCRPHPSSGVSSGQSRRMPQR